MGRRHQATQTLEDIDVKWYFGMNGNAETLATKLDTLYKVITEGDKNE